MSVNNASYAGFWIRLIAYILDLIAISILSPIVWYISFEIITYEPVLNLFRSTEEDGIVQVSVLWYLFLIPLIVTLFYFIYYPASKYKGTFGKQMLGLIIVDNDGNQISLGRSFLRFIGSIISSIIIYLGFIMIGFTEKKQGLHDFIGGTLVVYKSTYDPSQGGGGSQGGMPIRERYISDKAGKSDPIEELL